MSDNNFAINTHCFSRTPEGKRKCKLCPAVYNASTGSDSLRLHWHSKHADEAKALHVPLPSRERRLSFASSSCSSTSSLFSPRPNARPAQADTEHIDIDDPLPSPPILQPSSSAPSIFSSASIASSSSLRSSLSNKRVSESAAGASPTLSLMSPPSPPPIAKRFKQQDIRKHDSAGQQKTDAALNAQVAFFLYEGLALRVADSPYLKDWLDAYVIAGKAGVEEVANRRALAARAHGAAMEVKAQVIAKLRLCRGVTVGVDGWTNVRHDKVLNLCPVGRGVAYYWNSVVLKRSASAPDQVGPIAAGLRSIITAGIVVAAIVTDNEAVNGAMFRLLEDEFPFLLHIPCAAHTLQLCVKKALKLSPVAPCVNGLRALLLAFKHNKELRSLLKDQQGVMRRGKQPLQLITIVPTRWNSVYAAAERVIELQECLRPCIPSIIAQLAREKRRDYSELTYSDVSFWQPLAALIAFLVPYQIATDIVQSDDATVADAHHQLAGLMFRADALKEPHLLASVKEELKDIIHRQWVEHVNLNIVILCSQFSFDPAYTSFKDQEKVDADDWFVQWGAKFLKHYSLAVHDDELDIARTLEDQRSQFVQREGLFGSLEKRRSNLGSGKSLPRKLWGSYLTTVPEMAGCVVALLELTASEAAVERSFSRQGLVHTKTRNRLADDSVHVQMAFAFNSRALAISEGRPPPKRAAKEKDTREGAELLGDEDIAQGTTLLSQYLADDELAAASEDSEEEQADDEDVDESAVEEEVDEKERGDGKEESEDVPVEPAIDEKSMQERVEEVVSKFCEEARVTQGFRWNGPREQLLHALIVQAGIDVHLVDMKARVKASVASPSAAEAP
jgi:hypothetical protein